MTEIQSFIKRTLFEIPRPYGEEVTLFGILILFFLSSDPVWEQNFERSYSLSMTQDLPS